jgi:hypothetical protein
MNDAKVLILSCSNSFLISGLKNLAGAYGRKQLNATKKNYLSRH